jgi:hypothetical protein
MQPTTAYNHVLEVTGLTALVRADPSCSLDLAAAAAAAAVAALLAA